MSKKNAVKPLSEKRTFPRKALIIQNSPVSSIPLSWILKDAGFSVSLLPQSSAVLLMLDRFRPDFIILGEDNFSDIGYVESLSTLSYSLTYPLFLVQKTTDGGLSVRKVQPKNLPEREADSEVFSELQSIIKGLKGT